MHNPMFSPNLTDETEIELWEEEESRYWQQERSHDTEHQAEFREPDDTLYEREEEAYYNVLDY